MTIWGKHVIMKETLIVIISGREGSAPMVEKTIRRHPVRQRRIYTRGEEAGKAPSEANVKDLLPSAYPLSHKNTVPITSDGYRTFYFLYYFLILVFVFRFTLPGKYENRTHHGNHCSPYRLRC